jgi:predicted nucleic acid-binding protein
MTSIRTPRYVLDSGALIAAERGKARALRFFRLAEIGAAKLLVPFPVIAEWWRGRTDDRDDLLAMSEVVASVDAAKAAGVALAKLEGALAIDAIVLATAALIDGIVLTSDPDDFRRLSSHFPSVTVLSV